MQYAKKHAYDLDEVACVGTGIRHCVWFVIRNLYGGAGTVKAMNAAGFILPPLKGPACCSSRCPHRCSPSMPSSHQRYMVAIGPQVDRMGLQDQAIGHSQMVSGSLACGRESSA